MQHILNVLSKSIAQIFGQAVQNAYLQHDTEPHIEDVSKAVKPEGLMGGCRKYRKASIERGGEALMSQV